MTDAAPTDVSAVRSGKGHRDENFPVAGLIAPRHRPIVLAFYEFVRTGDDIADHPSLPAGEKIALLDRLRAELLGEAPPSPISAALRAALQARNLSARHALDLLAAFRLDATKTRYADWDDLLAYCRLSAMPVGRFVLDVHGEAKATWPASDALCAALQVINHLQDCRKDYRELDRVYLPLDTLGRHGVGVEALAAPQASPGLLACVRELAERTAGLLRDSAPLPDLIADTRLALEVAAIQRLAGTLADGLKRRDPLSERVHLGKVGFAVVALSGMAGGLARRAFRKLPAGLAAGSKP